MSDDGQSMRRSASEVKVPDQVLCRTCMRPITFETRTESGFKPREGWYDDCRSDPIVCFKSVDYRHVPLTERERAYWEHGYRVALASSWLATHDEQVRAEALAPVRATAEGWRTTLPIRFVAGRRVIDDIDVDDLVLDLIDVIDFALPPERLAGEVGAE